MEDLGERQRLVDPFGVRVAQGFHGGDVPKLEVTVLTTGLNAPTKTARASRSRTDHQSFTGNTEQLLHRVVTLEAEDRRGVRVIISERYEGERPQFDFGDVCDALAEVKVPTIAVLGGNVHGGGTDLAIACDLRVGSQEIVFEYPLPA